MIDVLDIGEFGFYEGKLVPLDYPILVGNEDHLNEAEYKGKKVDLNDPKRGGDGAYVYVNSGKKTKDGKIKVKKVSFGSSMPDAMGDSKAHKNVEKALVIDIIAQTKMIRQNRAIGHAEQQSSLVATCRLVVNEELSIY